MQIGFTKAEIKKFGETFQWDGEKNLSIYETKFESLFTQRSREYFLRKSQEWLTNLNCPEYLNEAWRRIEQEETKAMENMEHQTKGLLLEEVQREIIEKPAQKLAEMEGTGCRDMFKNKKLDELELMHRVFSRVENTLKFILDEMNPYIEGRGRIIVEDEELLKDPVAFTNALLELKSEMDTMVEQSFNKDRKF